MSESPSFGDSNAFLVDSVVASMMPSGPAAATRPLREAMLMRVAVSMGGGDHADVRRTFASPARERNPRDYGSSQSLAVLRETRLIMPLTSVWITGRSGPSVMPGATPAGFIRMASAELPKLKAMVAGEGPLPRRGVEF